MPLISEDTWHLRQQVLRKYGGMCACACGCHDMNLRHLQLDHRLGGGTQERSSIRGKNAYIKLMAEPVNPNMNPLCANCHFEKTMFGTCHGGLTSEKHNDFQACSTVRELWKPTPRQGVEVEEIAVLPPRLQMAVGSETARPSTRDLGQVHPSSRAPFPRVETPILTFQPLAYRLPPRWWEVWHPDWVRVWWSRC